MSLRKQASGIALMHAVDVLQPLLVLPYAAHVLGPHYFGKYAYALSIGQLAATIVGYGFHWTAQRAAAAARQEPRVIAAIFAEVVLAKTALCLLVTACGLIASGNLIAINRQIFLCAMLMAIGDIVFPVWLFIALENAWKAAIAVVISRGLALVSFFALVTSPAQLPVAIATQAGIPVISGFVCLPAIFQIGFDGFRSITLARIAARFKGGFRGFLFTLVETALLILPVPLVEHFAGFAAAGQYSVAEKFLGVTRPFFRVVSETFLPPVAYYAQHDPAAGIALIWKAFSTLVGGALLSFSLFFIAPYVILRFFGPEFSGAIPIIRLMAIVPILMNINVCTSNLFMFNYGHERAWAYLTISGLVIFLAVAFSLAALALSGPTAVALALVARQGFVLVISAGFFLAFASGKGRISPIENVAETRPKTNIAGFKLAAFARLARASYQKIHSER